MRIPLLGFENVVDAIADRARDLQELFAVFPRVAGEISSVQLFYDGRLNGSKADRVPIEPNFPVVWGVSERLIITCGTLRFDQRFESQALRSPQKKVFFLEGLRPCALGDHAIFVCLGLKLVDDEIGRAHV